MVEPITCLIVGCIISGVALLVSASIGFITIYSTLKIQKMNEKQVNKYKKAKEQIRNKYTFNSTPDDYLKIACLLHLVKSEARQCSHLNIASPDGKQIILTVSLQNIAIEYQPFKTWYKCKCLFDDNDKSIWVTFLDKTARSRFGTYLKDHVKTDDLLKRCIENNGDKTTDADSYNSEEDSETDTKDNYVPFDVYDKPSKNNLRRRKPNERLATKEDRRAYKTLGLKAPIFVPSEPPAALPPSDFLISK